MAHLCLSAAWGRTEGIGVDVHVHRLTNMWGWHTTRNPEGTRAALEAWLPREKWHEINWLLVGFGQTVCPSAGKRCGECTVGLEGLCKAADRGKVAAGRVEMEARMKVEEGDEAVDAKAKEGDEAVERMKVEMKVEAKMREEDKASVVGMKGEPKVKEGVEEAEAGMKAEAKVKEEEGDVAVGGFVEAVPVVKKEDSE